MISVLLEHSCAASPLPSRAAGRRPMQWADGGVAVDPCGMLVGTYLALGSQRIASSSSPCYEDDNFYPASS